MQGRSSARSRATGLRNQAGQKVGDKGAGTRQALLDATAELIKVHPIRELRVAQIARQADTSPATFYVYFKDVRDAVLTLATAATRAPPELLGSLADFWDGAEDEKAAAFVARYVAFWRENAALFRVRNLLAEEGNPEFCLALTNAMGPVVELLAARIRRAHPDAGLDSRALAGVLFSMIENVCQYSVFPPVLGISAEAMSNVAAYFLAMFVEAPRPRPPQGQARVRATYDVGLLSSPPDEARSAHKAKGLRMRARLVEATTRLLGARSVRDLTMAEIAKAAGITKATFYEYFDDVAAAVLAAVEAGGDMTALHETLTQALDRHGPLGGARLFVRAYMEWSRERSALIRVRNIAAEEGDVRFILSRIRAVLPLLMTLVGFVEQRQAEGKLPAGLDPFSAAGCVLATVERLAVLADFDLVGDAPVPGIVDAGARVLAVLVGGEAFAFAAEA